MIFVILGIIVLVASFLIALITLVREQNKAKDEESEESKSASPSIGEDAAKVGPVTQSKTPVEAPLQETSKPVVNRDLFPWEEGKYKTGSGEMEADRAKVEALRSQLAELKSRAVAAGTEVASEISQDVPAEPEPIVPPEPGPALNQPQAPLQDQQQEIVLEPKPQPKVKVQEPAQRLTGEVSISDLKG